LREKMFNRMQDLPIRYFDTNQRGDIMSHYTNDIDTLRQMISQSLPNLVMTVIVLTTVFSIMLYFSVWMCLVIVIGVLCMVALTKALGSNSARFFIAQQRELGVVEGHIEEVMGGQKVVKAFCHEAPLRPISTSRNERLFECPRGEYVRQYPHACPHGLGNLIYVMDCPGGWRVPRARRSESVHLGLAAVHRRGGSVPQHDQAVLRPDRPDLPADQRRGHGPGGR
ncbi:MAG: ABC transporter ATP-binding protein, partial [Collinsella intestinalis]